MLADAPDAVGARFLRSRASFARGVAPSPLKTRAARMAALLHTSPSASREEGSKAEPMARFLVVDDDHVTVTGMEKLLVEDGHEVAAFTSGRDAVTALAQQPFDAVVTDLEMPHVDGHEVVRATREHHPASCLVVATANAVPETRARLVSAGACAIADKPIDYDALTRSIAECRARRGPGLSGDCHLTSAPDVTLVPLRRK